MQAGGLGSSGLGIAASGPASQAGRFDAPGFGEKLFSAARDGVQGLGAGSAAMGGPLGAGAGMAMSEETKAVVEGNLKSIGKFFRRDMSGFGRFGGGGGGARNEGEGG